MSFFINLWKDLPPELRVFLTWIFDKHLGDLIKIATILFPIIFRKKIWRWLNRFRSVKALEPQLKPFTPEDIQRGIENYIWPDCQNADPSGMDEARLSLALREPLCQEMDKLLKDKIHFKHFILLADTGMGKTSFLLNYFVRHARRLRKPYEMAFVPLSQPNVAQRIGKIPNPEKTVLLLDAFDEDLEAINGNHSERLKSIIDWTRDFRKIVITCRTQFFPRDVELPGDTELFKATPRGPGESRQYTFYKLYLSPFNDPQIQAFLKRRFRFWQFDCRRQARQIIQNVPNLAVRPMLLTYVDTLIQSGNSFENAFQIYTAMVDGWLEREKELVRDKAALLDFSNKLAVDLYLNREKRGGERIPRAEIEPLARDFGIKLETWQLTGRSLLNRDAEGNYKFAHRSILEFLFATQVLAQDTRALKVPVRKWTEQIIRFCTEGNRGRFPKLFISFDGGPFEVKETGQKMDLMPFEMVNFPVTNVEYEKFDPSHRQKRDKYSDQDDQPVIYVSWDDAVKYCEWLSQQTGEKYSLPTEAEWEFAASGGGRREYPWGNEPPTPERANYHDSQIGKTTPVGSYLAGMTPEGLFDMAGNVWEWCQDRYDDKKDARVLRGGAFHYDLVDLRCAVRGGDVPDLRDYGIGFRVVRRA